VERVAYPDDLLVEGERVAWHAHPHWATQLRPAAMFPVTVAVASFAAAALRLQSWAPLAWLVLGLVGAVVVLRGTVLPLARWRATHIVVTDRRLMVREGLLSRQGLDVPVDRITSVRVRATPFGRLVGSGTLIVDTGDGEPMRFRDVGRVERVQARLHREISRVSARQRNETGTAGAVPERSAS
jgi:uncharacterized membrane protein YdbT with pleckstrin-like domain